MDNINNINNINNDDTITHLDTETEFHLMSERLFDMLSNISGFLQLYGNTYSEYVNKWRIKYQYES